MILAKLLGEIPSLDASSHLRDAFNRAKESKNSVDAFVVIEDGRPVGVLSSFELLEKIVEGADLKDVLVRDVMNHNILIVDIKTKPTDAARIMLDHKHWMAIVTEDEKYKGILTAGALVNK